MTSTLNIAALTRRTGVPPDTIRKWEQRYGVLKPLRTAGGQRRYTELDVARVEWLKARLAEGYRIGEAAALIGPGNRVPLSLDAIRTELVDAAVRNDVAGLPALVEQALALGSLERAFLDVLAPALIDVGELWEAGELGIAQEHLLSGTVRAALQRLLADARADVRGLAVLACGPGEAHEIGLLMFAVLLRADGWQVAYLGADTPTLDATALARDLRADALCFSVATPERARAVQTALRSAYLPPGLQLLIGGRGTDVVDPRAALTSLRPLAA